jgi:signal transduction histidine kinase
MNRAKLQTQMLISTLAVIVGMTVAVLFAVHLVVKAQIRAQEEEGVALSLSAFKSVQATQESELSRTAALLAELPTLKALVGTGDEPTVQDGSQPFWELAGSDLFALAASDGSILAVHTRRPGWTGEVIKRHLNASISRGDLSGWWADEGQLYWVFLRPITSGAGSERRDLGFIIVGYGVDTRIAQELARASRSQIVLAIGQHAIASTLPATEAASLDRIIAQEHGSPGIAARRTLSLDGKSFSATSIMLNSHSAEPIRCLVLTSEEDWAALLWRLDRLLFLLFSLAVVSAVVVTHLMSRTITKPLDSVVSGIEALARGDFSYSVRAQGSEEVQRLAKSFSVMREKLLESQRNMLAAERVAALDQTASSISHDLRHYLAAVVANAEFLYEAEALNLDRDEIYREIKLATEQMLELIDSMRELSRQHSSLFLQPANLGEVVRCAVELVDARQPFRQVKVTIHERGEKTGTFDTRKIQRAVFNLVLNACEAVCRQPAPEVGVCISGAGDQFHILVEDNGPGIPMEIRDRVFEPFISVGKSNGTGLGLAIAKKLVEEHGGTIRILRTGATGTAIAVEFPRNAVSVSAAAHS